MLAAAAAASTHSRPAPHAPPPQQQRKPAPAAATAAAADAPRLLPPPAAGAWRDMVASEHTLRDQFLMASNWMQTRLQLGAPAEHALLRQMAKLQLGVTAEGGHETRRLVVSSSVPPQRLHTEARTLAAPLTYRLNVLAHKHEASFCNGPHIDHATSGFQLPVRNIHAQFLATPANAAALPVVCHATPVATEAIVVCIDNPRGAEWARTQHASSVSLSTVEGFAQMTSMVRHNLAASVLEARKIDATRLHALLRIVTDRGIKVDAQWDRVASLFSLAEFMLIAHRDQVQQPLSKLFVVPVTSDNYESCVLLSVALTLLSDTYFTDGWVGGRGPFVKRTAGDVMVVVGGFWRAMAERGGGVAHPLGACFHIAAFEKAINANMQSMTNRNHSSFKLFGVTRVHRAEREAGDHACFCAYDAARVARYAALWPGAPLSEHERDVIDLTDVEAEAEAEAEPSPPPSLPSSPLLLAAVPAPAPALSAPVAVSIFDGLPDLPLALAAAPFSLLGDDGDEAAVDSSFSFAEPEPEPEPEAEEPPAKRARLMRAFLASVEETKRQAGQLGLRVAVEPRSRSLSPLPLGGDAAAADAPLSPFFF